MQLVRSIVNDTFPGVGGQQGRIFTNDAPFTLPYLNSAIEELSRRLRLEGVTFPIKDNVPLNNVPAVVKADPSVLVNIGFTGTNNGTTAFATPYLPGDCLQVYEVRARITGSNQQYLGLQQAQAGLVSGYQNQWLGMWEWRAYAIWLNGALQPFDLLIRYQSGQPDINVPAANFATTPIYIQDCKTALANLVAKLYGSSRGASETQITRCEAAAESAIAQMAEDYIRRGQTVNLRRQSYGGGGSNNTGNTGLGSTGVLS